MAFEPLVQDAPRPLGFGLPGVIKSMKGISLVFPFVAFTLLWGNEDYLVAPSNTAAKIVQVWLCLLAFVAWAGGALQFCKGSPVINATWIRYDNVHRFLGGIYFGCGFICWHTAFTLYEEQAVLVYAIALSVFVGAAGRVVSMLQFGLPANPAVWVGYLGFELLAVLFLTVGQALS